MYIEHIWSLQSNFGHLPYILDRLVNANMCMLQSKQCTLQGLCQEFLQWHLLELVELPTGWLSGLVKAGRLVKETCEKEESGETRADGRSMDNQGAGRGREMGNGVLGKRGKKPSSWMTLA